MPNKISDHQFVRYTILSAQLALAEGYSIRAKRNQRSARLMQAQTKEPLATQIQLREMRASLLYNIAEFRQAIMERIALEPLLKGDT
ncbi:penicillin-binding protein activator, partial [Saccharophagus degradans]|nr:penicillin-binding protein activator [Saccharophagus degradans]